MNSTVRKGPPSIVKAAERLLDEIEKAVAAFPRKHRYSLGADLRVGGLNAVLLTQRAYRSMSERNRQAVLIKELADVVDQLKIQLQLAQRLQCYSFQRFELLARLVVDVGKQCGGWKRQIECILKGQNSAPMRQPERAQTLSTRAASTSEAHA